MDRNKSAYRRFQNAVKLGFMKEKLDGRLHPALDITKGNYVFDQDTDSVRSFKFDDDTHVKHIERADTTTKKFLDRVNEYERQVPEPYKTKIDLSGDIKHSWQEVLEEVQNVDDIIDRKDAKNKASPWGKLREGLRRASSKDRSFAAFIQLLPSESLYGSVLCGGMMIIVGAAKRLNDLREETTDVLLSIPDLIGDTHLILEVYQTSDDLRRCSIELYESIIQVLGRIVTWYRERALAKIVKAVFMQGLYGEDLSERIKDIERISDRFKELAVICSHQTLMRNATLSEQNNQLIRQSSQELIQSHQEENKKTREHLTRHMSNEIATFVESTNAKFERIAQRAIASAVTKLMKQLSANTIVFHEPESPATESSEPPKVDIKIVLENLDYEPMMSETDIQQCIRFVGPMNIEDQGRALAVWENKVFLEWATSSTSLSSLLINGNSRIIKRSPLTLFCARLIESLRQEDSFYVLYFFCGEHMDLDRDHDACPAGILNSILAQLLEQYDGFDVDKIYKDLNRLKNDDIKSLSRLFEKLIKQVPVTTTVYCIIDNISYYEDAERSETTSSAVDFLVELGKQKLECRFKFLATCPRKSREVWRLFSKEETLNMPAYCGKRGRFSASKMLHQIGNKLDLSSYESEEEDVEDG